MLTVESPEQPCIVHTGSAHDILKPQPARRACSPRTVARPNLSLLIHPNLVSAHCGSLSLARGMRPARTGIAPCGSTGQTVARPLLERPGELNKARP